MSIAYDTFKSNLEYAERILLIAEVKKRLDEVPRLFPGTPLEQIRDFLSERANEIFDIAKPLLLVFVTACLEYYLTSVGERKTLARMIDRWRKVAGDKLTKDVHEMRIKRNIIIHNAQIVGENAIKEFRKYSIEGYSECARLKLDIGEVREFLSEARKFVEAIEKGLKLCSAR